MVTWKQWKQVARRRSDVRALSDLLKAGCLVAVLVLMLVGWLASWVKEKAGDDPAKAAVSSYKPVKVPTPAKKR